MKDRIALMLRNQSFDPNEVGAYEIVIVTRDGNAGSVHLTRDEALGIYGDMQVEFDA